MGQATAIEAAGIDLDAIRERADAATEGPWRPGTTGVRGGDHWFVAAHGEAIAHIASNDGCNEAQREPDATFICHARTDVPALLAEVQRLRDELGVATTVRDAHLARAERAEARVAELEAGR